MTSPTGRAAAVIRRSRNRRAIHRFGEFWTALQQVGDVLAEAERLATAATDTRGRDRVSRHWNIATPEEVKSSLKRCRNSLRVLSSSAKRFEPELIVRDWRR